MKRTVLSVYSGKVLVAEEELDGRGVDVGFFRRWVGRC